MELLLVLTYSAICIGVFKLFKIPLTKWTVPTAVLGGIALVGSLIFAMNYNHPFSASTREYFVTTPIIAGVRGRVIEVPVKSNQLLAQGDVLFRIDPQPFENKVTGLEAQLLSARADLERATALAKTNSGPQRNVDIAQANVDAIGAQLADAQYNLEQTVVRAPTDGFVSQLFLRPGMEVVPMPLRPALVFIHQEARTFVGWYPQNSLLRLAAGSYAEVAFDGVPGRVFSAEVVGPLPVMAEGELQASGNLISVPAHHTAGLVPVVLRVDDPEFIDIQHKIPGGAFAQSAIYSEHLHHLAVMRKILLRMASWMNYFYPIH